MSLHAYRYILSEIRDAPMVCRAKFIRKSEPMRRQLKTICNICTWCLCVAHGTGKLCLTATLGLRKYTPLWDNFKKIFMLGTGNVFERIYIYLFISLTLKLVYFISVVLDGNTFSLISVRSHNNFNLMTL